MKQYRIGKFCTLVKGLYPTMKTEPGEYPLVVTAAYRRSASTYQLDRPSVCVPLVSSTGHGDAALHRVHYQDGKYAIANLLVALVPRDERQCDARYLYHLLNTKRDELLVPLMQGTANVSLKVEDIAEVEVSLPPLAEQRRIVAKIDQLAAKIDEARGLRQGAATEAEVLSHSAMRGVFVRRPGWNVVPLERACFQIIDCPHSNPVYSDDGVPTVRSPDVSWGSVNLDQARRTSEDEYQRRTRRGEVRPGDIILVREGGGTGKAGVVEDGQRFSLGQRVMMLRPDASLVEPRFMLYQWLSPPIYEAQIVERTKGSASPHLNIKALRKFEFLLPPLAEQRRIVAYLDAVQAKVDGLKALQSQTAAELDALLPSILDRAFKGGL